eukprot:scaffold974_cov176-Ochromonas_danica.AAC.4
MEPTMRVFHGPMTMTMMTFKQLIWQHLPRDLLHCVYSEWLSWSDLSAVDIACLSNLADREEWLSSLSSLLKTEACSLVKTEYDYVNNERLVSYYKWLGSRKVLVRDKFPMRLSVLDDLLHYCDPVTFCPALHSIVILIDNERTDSCDDSILIESSLSRFLSHCIHLEGINEAQSGIERDDCVKWNSILYTALTNHLQENQLMKMGVFFGKRDNVLIDKVGSLLSKHDKSLKELAVRDRAKDNPGLTHVLENLIKSKHALRVLNIVFTYKGGNSTIIPSLLQYLSSAGMFLETLTVYSFEEGDFCLSEDLILSIGRSCPKLERLSWDVEGVSDEIVKPSLIYHLCPNLKYLSLQDCEIDVDEDINRMFLTIPSQPVDLEDSIECLLLALQRRPCTHVGLSIYNEEIELGVSEWSLIKSKLGPVLTSLRGLIPEDVIMDFVADLPNLKILCVLTERYEYSDNCLSSIAEHGQNLTELHFFGFIQFSDEILFEVFRRCSLLEVLDFSGLGCQSILYAAQHLSRLRKAMFDSVIASEADIVSLLHSEDMRWPSCLRTGEISSIHRGYKFEYKPNSLGWHKVWSSKQR